MFEQFEVNSICKSASTPRFNLCSSIASKLTAPFLLARLVLDPRTEVIGKKFLGVWAFWVWHHLTKKVPHFQWQQEHLLLRDHSYDFLSKISLIVCVFCLFVCFFFHFSEILVPSFLIKLTFSCFYHYQFFFCFDYAYWIHLPMSDHFPCENLVARNNTLLVFLSLDRLLCFVFCFVFFF